MCTRILCDYNMEDEYDKYDDKFNSSSAEESFQHATLIATLAERFSLTSFKPFQKNIITAAIEGNDTLVVQPTGTGKSLYVNVMFVDFVILSMPNLLMKIAICQLQKTGLNGGLDVITSRWFCI